MNKLIFTFAFSTIFFISLSISQRSTDNNPGLINLYNGTVPGVSISGGSTNGSFPSISFSPGTINVNDLSGDSRISLLGNQFLNADIPLFTLTGSVPAGTGQTFMILKDDLTNNSWNIGLNSTDFGAYLDFKYIHAEGSTMTTAYISSGGFFTSSDKSLKTNIKSLDSTLGTLMKINSTYYNRKISPELGEYGFIAQEIQKIFPEMVRIIPTDDGEQYMMNYSQMIPVLTQSIQEQQYIINQQEKTIDDLLVRMEILENKLKK